MGRWKNQYGSIVAITDRQGDRIGGVFITALEDSGFHGQEAPIVGVVRGNCIAFSCVGTAAAGDMVVSYTGLFRNGRMETMWYCAANEAITAAGRDGAGERRQVPWWKAIVANADTFERIAERPEQEQDR